MIEKRLLQLKKFWQNRESPPICSKTEKIALYLNLFLFTFVAIKKIAFISNLKRPGKIRKKPSPPTGRKTEKLDLYLNWFLPN